MLPTFGMNIWFSFSLHRVAYDCPLRVNSNPIYYLSFAVMLLYFLAGKSFVFLAVFLCGGKGLVHVMSCCTNVTPGTPC